MDAILTALREEHLNVISRYKTEEPIFSAYIKVDSHLSKKNNRPFYRNRATGKYFLGKSAKLASTEDYLVHQLRLQGHKLGITKPFDFRVWCVFVLYFKDYYVKNTKKNEPQRMSKWVVDQSNGYQIYEDALEKAGIILNDQLISSHDLSRRLPGHENALALYVYRF